ncbi:hypothetical protein F5887DRAFT_1208413 [Amanita rubescens]|nr:hypothetical protein F5887DRAFT_1208413 [Amanita rubescens]
MIGGSNMACLCSIRLLLMFSAAGLRNASIGSGARENRTTHHSVQLSTKPLDGPPAKGHGTSFAESSNSPKPWPVSQQLRQSLMHEFRAVYRTRWDTFLPRDMVFGGMQAGHEAKAMSPMAGGWRTGRLERTEPSRDSMVQNPHGGAEQYTRVAFGASDKLMHRSGNTVWDQGTTYHGAASAGFRQYKGRDGNEVARTRCEAQAELN